MRFVVLAALLIGCADEDKGTTGGDETETQDETGNDETTDEEGSSTDDDTNDPVEVDCADGFEPTGLSIGSEPAFNESTPLFTWDAANECIASFEIAWGASDVDDLVAWTDIGQGVSAQNTDVTLISDETYTFSVRAVSPEGERSAIVTSEPFSVFRPDDLDGVHLWMDSTVGVYSDSQCSVEATDGEDVKCWASRAGGWYARNTLGELPDLDAAQNDPDYLYPASMQLTIDPPTLDTDGWANGLPTINFAGDRALLVNDGSNVPFFARYPVLNNEDGLTIFVVDMLSANDEAASDDRHYAITSEKNYLMAFDIGFGNLTTNVVTSGSASEGVWYPSGLTPFWGPSQAHGEIYWMNSGFRQGDKGLAGWRYDGVTHNHYFNGKSVRTSITPTSHQGQVVNEATELIADNIGISIEDYVMLGGRLGDEIMQITSYEGDQAEILVFSRALNDDEVQWINRYLMDKWSLKTAEELEIEVLGEPHPALPDTGTP